MPVIEINGKKVEAEAGSMIIEVADNTQIQIPRFCYHKKLSIAANCRMCLVEVEKAPKPLPACATPVTEGMKIWTHSPKALQAQKSVLEFLLINHPLDCPICDQGGECELQDLSMGYGSELSRFQEGKRAVQDKNLGPLIASDMTRCIHCTRCVRFGSEVAGLREIGATGRGECTEIGTFIEQAVESEVSGNIIDLCPVGALTSKPFRFAARGWELKQTANISPHDCVGSNLFLHTRRETVMRVVPRENEDVNESWLSDRDRFSYEALTHETRLTVPKIKKNGVWCEVSWSDALIYCAKALKAIVQKSGGGAIGALASGNAAIEDHYLLQKLMRAMGSNHVDHRLRQIDFRLDEAWSLYPNLGLRLKAIESQSLFLLIGCNLRKEQPLLALKLRKMTANGGKICVVNPLQCSFNFEVTETVIVKGNALVLAVAKIAKALCLETKHDINDVSMASLQSLEPSTHDRNIALLLLKNKNAIIWLGALATSHPDYSQLMAWCNLIAEITDATIGILTEGANQAGAFIAGCVPHYLPGGKAVTNLNGLSVQGMLDNPLSAYLLLNIDPDLDCANGFQAINALKASELVISITAFESPVLLETANVLLPLAPFSETEGTFVNGESIWQSFKAAVTPRGEARHAWEILSLLGQELALQGFAYRHIAEVLQALKNEIPETIPTKRDLPLLPVDLQENDDIVLLRPVPLYAADALVRRAKSLQATQDAGTDCVFLNSHLLERLKISGQKIQVTTNNGVFKLPFAINDQLPNNTVFVWGGRQATFKLGAAYQIVQLKNVRGDDD